MADILQTLVQLVETFCTLLIEVGALALRHILLIAWVAWWLWGVNWTKAWGVLARGGWAVVVLLICVVALAWSALVPSTLEPFQGIRIGNFWWQLGAVSLAVLLALFCGYVQGVFGWAPAEINLDPPPQSHSLHHGHTHH